MKPYVSVIWTKSGVPSCFSEQKYGTSVVSIIFGNLTKSGVYPSVFEERYGTSYCLVKLSVSSVPPLFRVGSASGK